MNQTLISTEDISFSGRNYTIDELKYLAKEEKGKTNKLYVTINDIRKEIGEISNIYYRQGQIIGDVRCK